MDFALERMAVEEQEEIGRNALGKLRPAFYARSEHGLCRRHYPLRICSRPQIHKTYILRHMPFNLVLT